MKWSKSLTEPHSVPASFTFLNKPQVSQFSESSVVTHLRLPLPTSYRKLSVPIPDLTLVGLYPTRYLPFGEMAKEKVFSSKTFTSSACIPQKKKKNRDRTHK